MLPRIGSSLSLSSLLPSQSPLRTIQLDGGKLDANEDRIGIAASAASTSLADWVRLCALADTNGENALWPEDSLLKDEEAEGASAPKPLLRLPLLRTPLLLLLLLEGKVDD